MKRLTLALLAVLFLPLTSEGTIKRYDRGYTDTWCADQTQTIDGTVVLAVDPKSPTTIKGYCYAKAVTDWTNNTMAGHKTRAAVTLIGPTGIRADKDSTLKVGITSAAVQVPYYNWSGEFQSWFQVGEVYCPFGQMTAAGLFSTRKRRLGVSTICLVRDGNPARPVRLLALGPQVGWNAGYFPIEPCNVNCKATHYTIYIASPGGSITPAPSGTANKGWSKDLDSGVVTCTGYAVTFTPDGIPGILPCASKGCKQTTFDVP